MANFISGILSLTIGAVVLSSVFIATIKTTDTASATCYYANNTPYTCSWSAGEIALWGLLSLVGIAGMVYGVMNVFGIN